MSDFESDIDSSPDDDRREWLPEGPRGASAYADMAATLSGDGLLTPPVPTRLARDLMTAGEWAWATNAEWSPWAGYILEGASGPPTLPTCLGDGVEDFWLFAHRGHGQGSYGIGMVARVGRLVIAQQHLYGGFRFFDSDVTPEVVINRATQTWGRTLEALEQLGQSEWSGPADYLVAFSDYRNYAVVASPHFSVDSNEQFPGNDRWLPYGWGWFDYDQVGARPAESSDPLFLIADRHVRDLVDGSKRPRSGD